MRPFFFPPLNGLLSESLNAFFALNCHANDLKNIKSLEEKGDNQPETLTLSLRVRHYIFSFD